MHTAAMVEEHIEQAGRHLQTADRLGGTAAEAPAINDAVRCLLAAVKELADAAGVARDPDPDIGLP